MYSDMMAKFYHREHFGTERNATVKYLVLIQRVDVQLVKRIPVGTLPLRPLLHLCGRHIMRRVHIAGLPLACLELFVDATFTLRFVLVEKALAIGQATAAEKTRS